MSPTKKIPDSTDEFEVVAVTPAIAAEWLTHNTHNRTLKLRAIARFADDMRNGDWTWTGVPILFAADGMLLDGQNRLHAIVESGRTIKCLVVRGLAAEAQRDVDTGTPRRLHDILQLAGEPNASSLAALIVRVSAWESGHRRSLTNGTSASNAQSLRTLEKHPELRELVNPSRTVGTKCGAPASIIGLAWWLFDQIDSEDASFFFERLADGQAMTKGDPIYELRRTLQDSKSIKGERNLTWMLAITIKAWNAYRSGEVVSLYRWRPGGAKPEKFPEPV